MPLGRGGASDPLDDLAQMLGGGAAAAADEREAVLAYEGLLGVGEFRRRERVVGAVAAEDRQARVGHAGQLNARVAGQVAQVLAHLGRSGGAVQPDHVDAERFQRGERGADLRAEQHGAGRLDRHRHDERDLVPGRLHGPAGGQDGGLGLQQVLGGLHQQRVGAACEQALGVLLVRVTDDIEGGVAEGGQLGAGAHRAQHPALAAVARGELVRRLAGDAGTGLGQFGDALGNVVFTQGGEVRAEGVGLHAVDARVEVLGMHRADDVRTGHVEDLVAALQLLEVVQCGVLRLQHGAHRSVGDHHSGGQRLTERGRTGPAVGGRGQWRRGHLRGSLGCDGCRLCTPPWISRGGRTSPG